MSKEMYSEQCGERWYLVEKDSQSMNKKRMFTHLLGALKSAFQSLMKANGTWNAWGNIMPSINLGNIEVGLYPGRGVPNKVLYGEAPSRGPPLPAW